jgi:hypothetical protein
VGSPHAIGEVRLWPVVPDLEDLILVSNDRLIVSGECHAPLRRVTLGMNVDDTSWLRAAAAEISLLR